MVFCSVTLSAATKVFLVQARDCSDLTAQLRDIGLRVCDNLTAMAEIPNFDMGNVQYDVIFVYGDGNFKNIGRKLANQGKTVVEVEVTGDENPNDIYSYADVCRQLLILAGHTFDRVNLASLARSSTPTSSVVTSRGPAVDMSGYGHCDADNPGHVTMAP